MANQEFDGICSDCCEVVRVSFDEQPPSEDYRGKDKLGGDYPTNCPDCGQTTAEVVEYNGYF